MIKKIPFSPPNSHSNIMNNMVNIDGGLAASGPIVGATIAAGGKPTLPESKKQPPAEKPKTPPAEKPKADPPATPPTTGGTVGQPPVALQQPFSYDPFTYDKQFTYDDFSYGDFSYADYAESEAVKQANALLQQQIAANPGAYQSQWQNQINDYLNQIENREAFSYDPNSDALYNMYKDMYVQQGQMAMMDTMGQAASMTGGYGNSYAQTIGQQAYNQQISQLNNVLPELYQQSYNRYADEGQRLQDMYNMYLGREEQDYGRYMDEFNAWQAERDYLANRYDYERDYDYSKWESNRNLAYDQYTSDRNLAYDQYSAGRETAWQEYLNNLEKEQAAAELMASAGVYDRLGSVYGLTDDELAALKDANAPKGTGGPEPKTPKYTKLTHEDRQLMQKEVDRVTTISELNNLVALYLSMGYDPDVVNTLTKDKAKALAGGTAPDSTEVQPTQTGTDTLTPWGKEQYAKWYSSSGGRYPTRVTLEAM